MKSPTEKDVEEVDEWLKLKITTGKVSRLLVNQLACGLVNRTLHVHRIYDEIGLLEGAPCSRSTNTKPPSKFNRAPLRGLWHKHYTGPSHIINNIGLHWGKNLERFTFIEDKILGTEESVELTPEIIGRTVHAFVVESFEQRNADQKMTGEWIVYAILDGKNYYLTLGAHNEDDDAIATRVRQCASEFPNLQLNTYV